MTHSLPAIGIDTEPLARWRAKVTALAPGGTLHRLFDAAEHARAARKRDPIPTYAGIWCAREAAAKALRAWVGVGPRRLHVAHDAAGRPRIVLPPALTSRFALDISISHSADTAIAVALALPVPGGELDRPPHCRVK